MDQEEDRLSYQRYNLDKYWISKLGKVVARPQTIQSSDISVFCPGFQKGRVPSEKGTLAR